MISSFGKMDENFNIGIYVEFLRSINKITDDYMFLWEFKTGMMWFGESVSKRVPIQNKGLDYCYIDDVMAVTHPRDRQVLEEDLEIIINEEKDVHDMEYRWVDNDGKSEWVNCRGTALRDTTGNTVAMFGRVSPTTLMYHMDKKTGIFNKSKMFERVEDIYKLGKKGHFVLYGIDDIKAINSRYGRKQGDFIIKRVAHVLASECDNPYNIFRLDGDYFGVCSYDEDKNNVLKEIKSCQDKLRDICTLSVGVVPYDDIDVKEPSVLYQYAENLMSNVKQNGKDGVALFEKETCLGLQIGFADELRESVKNGFDKFSLVFQPLIDINDESIYGA